MEANSRKNLCVTFDFFMYMWYRSFQLVLVEVLDSFVEYTLQLVRFRPQEIIKSFKFAILVEGKN